MVEQASRLQGVEEARAELGSLIVRMGAMLRRRFVGVAAQHGLTPPLVGLLREVDQPTPMGWVAERMCVDASYVTGLVDRLEELGLVERRPDPSDRRVKQIVVTAEGSRVRALIDRSLVESTDLFGRLDDEELVTFVALLRKVVAEESPDPDS